MVFGPEWVSYSGVFSWISLLLLVRSTNGPIDALLMARGWVKRELAYAVAAMGAVVGALLYAVGEGLEAAVVSVTVINLAMSVPVYLWLVRPAGYVGRRQYLLAVGGPLGLAIAATSFAYGLAYGLGERPGPRLAIGIAGLTVSFSVGLAVAYPSSWRWAVGVFAKWRGRSVG